MIKERSLRPMQPNVYNLTDEKVLPLAFLLFWACEALTVNPPPEVLLKEDEMEEIIYDRLLLRTMESSRLIKEDSLNILMTITSFANMHWKILFLQQNLEYYAQYPRRMTALYDRVEVRLNRLLDSLEQLAKKENEALAEKED